jgi:(2R)-3-sulfolactate dehydrogenase (NADP+)
LDQQILSADEAQRLAERACLAAGANQATACALAKATTSAALFGRSGVGFPHLLDYLSGFRTGRINGEAEPTLVSPLPAILYSNGDGGVAQYGFDRALPTLVQRTGSLGVTVFTQSNSYPPCELGL